MRQIDIWQSLLTTTLIQLTKLLSSNDVFFLYKYNIRNIDFIKFLQNLQIQIYLFYLNSGNYASRRFFLTKFFIWIPLKTPLYQLKKSKKYSM